MVRRILIFTAIFAIAAGLRAEDAASVHVTPPNLQGPRPLARQTASAVVRDYLEAWQAMSVALAENRASALDPDFAGVARDKLGATVEQQMKLGIRTQYRAESHDIDFLFYSPDGLSVQLVDDVNYDLQIQDHDKVQAQQHLHARYVVVLTPAEVRWRVRVLQALPD